MGRRNVVTPARYRADTDAAPSPAVRVDSTARSTKKRRKRPKPSTHSLQSNKKAASPVADALPTDMTLEERKLHCLALKVADPSGKFPEFMLRAGLASEEYGSVTSGGRSRAHLGPSASHALISTRLPIGQSRQSGRAASRTIRAPVPTHKHRLWAPPHCRRAVRTRASCQRARHRHRLASRRAERRRVARYRGPVRRPLLFSRYYFNTNLAKFWTDWPRCRPPPHHAYDPPSSPRRPAHASSNAHDGTMRRALLRRVQARSGCRAWCSSTTPDRHATPTHVGCSLIATAASHDRSVRSRSARWRLLHLCNGMLAVWRHRGHGRPQPQLVSALAHGWCARQRGPTGGFARSAGAC